MSSKSQKYNFTPDEKRIYNELLRKYYDEFRIDFLDPDPARWEGIESTINIITERYDDVMREKYASYFNLGKYIDKVLGYEFLADSIHYSRGTGEFANVERQNPEGKEILDAKNNMPYLAALRALQIIEISAQMYKIQQFPGNSQEMAPYILGLFGQKQTLSDIFMPRRTKGSAITVNDIGDDRYPYTTLAKALEVSPHYFRNGIDTDENNLYSDPLRISAHTLPGRISAVQDGFGVNVAGALYNDSRQSIAKSVGLIHGDRNKYNNFHAKNAKDSLEYIKSDKFDQQGLTVYGISGGVYANRGERLALSDMLKGFYKGDMNVVEQKLLKIRTINFAVPPLWEAGIGKEGVIDPFVEASSSIGISSVTDKFAPSTLFSRGWNHEFIRGMYKDDDFVVVHSPYSKNKIHLVLGTDATPAAVTYNDQRIVNVGSHDLINLMAAVDLIKTDFVVSDKLKAFGTVLRDYAQGKLNLQEKNLADRLEAVGIKVHQLDKKQLHSYNPAEKANRGKGEYKQIIAMQADAMLEEHLEFIKKGYPHPVIKTANATRDVDINRANFRE